jgi:hypothetical protein
LLKGNGIELFIFSFDVKSLPFITENPPAESLTGGGGKNPKLFLPR